MMKVLGDRIMQRHISIALVLLFSLLAWITGCQPTPTAEPISEPQISLTATRDEASVEKQAESVSVSPTAFEEHDELTTSTPVEPLEVADDLVLQLKGLSLSDFFEVSTRALTMRSPEVVLEMGLTDTYGVTDIRLDDISDGYQRETYQMIAVILEMLQSYDRSVLSHEDQISYDIYQWYLEDRLAEQEFMYYDYPATYYPITAVHENLITFFTDIHPVRDLADGRDFVTRLGQVGAKIDQLIENLEIRAAAGIQPPQFAIQWSVYGSLGQFVEMPAIINPIYTAFKEKLDPLSSVTPEDRQVLLAEAEQTITEVVVPAYQDLLSYLSRLETYSGGDSGVWRLPQGEAYYANRIRHNTTTDLSAEEIHQLGLEELDRIHGEMRTVFQQLGYPQDISIVQAYDRVAQDGGHIPGNQVLETYKALISEADQNLSTAFDISPETGVIVIPVQYGDYYVSGSFDGSRPGVFYAGIGSAGKDYYAMPTLAYHETIPGHHFQITLAQEMKSLPSFRRALVFTAYAEGWALYAERLAWELGWYEDDPYGYLGFLQAQAFRATRLVVDTGLHASGWTFDQAQGFFTENTGFDMDDNVNPQHEIARYLVWPGQSVSYYIGYLKFMEMRQRAMDELGDKFDLKEFHRLLLSNGSMPLEVLERVVDGYIREKLGS
jgi:uncharacterized protein (DUF885 family)